MFIDMHVHPAFYEPICQDAEMVRMRHEKLQIHRNSAAPLDDVKNKMDCAGIDKLCLLPMDVSSVDGKALVMNEEIASLIAMEPQRFIGFAGVDPLKDDACGKLEYAFDELKLKGLKLNLGRLHCYPDDERLEAVYQFCESRKKPIIFHSGLSWEPDCVAKYCRPMEFEEMVQRHPNLKICLAHFGWPWTGETAMLMVKYPNVYADTGVLYFDSALEFYKKLFTQDIPVTWIDRSLRHQVMFGSDAPRFEQMRMAKALDHLGFRESTLELIKGQNALEFIGV
ncbi:amidohydrolase family protein [Roseburia hominis]